MAFPPIQFSTSYTFYFSAGERQIIQGLPFFETLSDPACQDIVRVWESGAKFFHINTQRLQLVRCEKGSHQNDHFFSSNVERTAVRLSMIDVTDCPHVIYVPGSVEETAQKIRDASTSNGFICLSNGRQDKSLLCRASVLLNAYCTLRQVPPQ